MHGKRLSAGNLRHMVLIQQVIQTQNSDGTVGRYWEDVTKCYASIDPVSAREFLIASTTESQISARITIRYKSGITAKMRVKHGNNYYNIEGVQSDMDSNIEYLTLICSTGVLNEDQADL